MKLIFVLYIIAFTTSVHAEALKKGHVMCQGPGCVDMPQGGVAEVAGQASQEVEKEINRIQDENKENKKHIKNGEGERDKKSEIGKAKNPKKQPKSSQVDHGDHKNNRELTNLPEYYQGIDRSHIEASEKSVFVPKSGSPKLKGLKAGDIIWAIIEQEVKASQSVPTPVRAIAISGAFKGGVFLGEATLDRELKRVLFSFSKLRPKNNETTYLLKASGLSPQGSVGIEGEYTNQTGKFFIAELAAAAAAGYVDATIARTQNVQGNYVQEPSLGNSGKVAAASALSKTTDRMAENARSAPEYTHINGYQEIQIIIQDDPVESGN